MSHVVLAGGCSAELESTESRGQLETNCTVRLLELLACQVSKYDPETKHSALKQVHSAEATATIWCHEALAPALENMEPDQRLP